MASPIRRRGGKKNRKHGRWSRAPSMRVYVATNRLAINRARRIEKDRRLKERARRKRLDRSRTYSGVIEDAVIE